MASQHNYFNFLNNKFPLTSDYGKKTCQWSNFDSLDNYTANGNKDIPPDSVWYNFNSYGYRCDEFDESTQGQTIFIGCSVTFGEGVAQEETWPYLVFKELQQNDPSQTTYINLSTPGSSWDYAVRTLLQVVPKLKPKKVVAYLPSIYRREVLYPLDNNSELHVCPINFVPGTDDSKFDVFSVVSKCVTVEEYVAYRLAMNLRTLELVCKSEHTELTLACWDQDFRRFVPAIVNPEYGNVVNISLKRGFREEPRARDGSHPGTKVHRDIYSEFIKHVL